MKTSYLAVIATVDLIPLKLPIDRDWNISQQETTEIQGEANFLKYIFRSALPVGIS